jgi:putative transposase
MPRKPRNLAAESLYHVVSRGNRKLEIFHDLADYSAFLGYLLRFKAEFGISIFHYVLMPNHIHLLLRPIGGDCSEFMRRLKKTYADYYNFKYAKIGHVWQGRFKSSPIDTDAYLLACGNYIEMNPVRAGLAAQPDQWPYSSFHHYAEGRWDPIVEDSPFYSNLGENIEKRMITYKNQLNTTRSGA